jgi:hypothetical protein
MLEGLKDYKKKYFKTHFGLQGSPAYLWVSVPALPKTSF